MLTLWKKPYAHVNMTDSVHPMHTFRQPCQYSGYEKGAKVVVTDEQKQAVLQRLQDY